MVGGRLGNYTIAQEKLRSKQYKLNAFLDWCVFRQEFPVRRATVKVWCEFNWPEANEEDIDFIHTMSTNQLAYTQV